MFVKVIIVGLHITSRYPVEYPRSFVLGGKKIFRSGEGKGIRGEEKKLGN